MTIFNPGSIYNKALTEGKGDKVIGILFESPSKSWYKLKCPSLFASKSEGSFGKGPYCEYKPTEDGVE